MYKRTKLIYLHIKFRFAICTFNCFNLVGVYEWCVWLIFTSITVLHTQQSKEANKIRVLTRELQKR